ncbi:hypothetical protein CDCA_CDCA09G2745 [Cyanidium caldarium]|uniref:Hcy-binding domain-containing protein n=1 Tax=Cyanidium caldarium TaxID=2771 RepID=A0AAV9IWM1_CYACA|nr:hypothetical protein CDCA_CDCA09G2745 [Cyanidium caldarium]
MGVVDTNTLGESAVSEANVGVQHSQGAMQPVRRWQVLERMRHRSQGRRLPCLVLDGGMATELERRGHDLSGVDAEEWSASVLRRMPSDVVHVHRDYIEAGADVVSTATYQARADLFARGVELVDEAWRGVCDVDERNVRRRRPFCALSLGPYAAFLRDGSEYSGYRWGDLSRPQAAEKLSAFHAARVEAALPWLRGEAAQPDAAQSPRASADWILFETVPDALEAECIARLMSTRPACRQAPWALSFQARMDDGRGVLAAGESVAAAVDRVLSACSGDDENERSWLANGNGPLYLGFNCCAPQDIGGLLGELTHCRHAVARNYRARCQAPSSRPDMSPPPFLGWCVYPNSGERWDASRQRWTPSSDMIPLDSAGARHFWHKHLPEWRALGAALVGGCCRVGPTIIEALTRAVRSGDHERIQPDGQGCEYGV